MTALRAPAVAKVADALVDLNFALLHADGAQTEEEMEDRRRAYAMVDEWVHEYILGLRGHNPNRGK